MRQISESGADRTDQSEVGNEANTLARRRRRAPGRGRRTGRGRARRSGARGPARASGDGPGGWGLGAAGETGGGGDGGVGARMDAQQPEHPRGLATELPGGPGEHRPHAGRWVAGIYGVQAVGRIGELAGQDGQREPRPGGGASRGGRQRERRHPRLAPARPTGQRAYSKRRSRCRREQQVLASPNYRRWGSRCNIRVSFMLCCGRAGKRFDGPNDRTVVRRRTPRPEAGLDLPEAQSAVSQSPQPRLNHNHGRVGSSARRPGRHRRISRHDGGGHSWSRHRAEDSNGYGVRGSNIRARQHVPAMRGRPAGAVERPLVRPG